TTLGFSVLKLSDISVEDHQAPFLGGAFGYLQPAPRTQTVQHPLSATALFFNDQPCPFNKGFHLKQTGANINAIHTFIPEAFKSLVKQYDTLCFIEKYKPFTNTLNGINEMLVGNFSCMACITKQGVAML